MPYNQITLPTETPDDIKAIVRQRLDPMLCDVHAMLRMPKGYAGMGSGCHLSAALVLMSVVSGISGYLYSHGLPNPEMHSGRLFKDVLRRFFPWCEEPLHSEAVTGGAAADRLYEALRNPLVHNLGLYGGDAYMGKIKIVKGPLLERDIVTIEQSEHRPLEWTKPTLRDRGGDTVLTLKCFYWGVRRMVFSVVRDRVESDADDPAPPPTTMSTVGVSATASSTIARATRGVGREPTGITPGSTSTGDENE